MLTPLTKRIVAVALFLMATGNVALFKRLLEIYPPELGNMPFLLSLTVFFTVATILFLLLICFGRAGNWLLALFLLLGSQAAYYMDQFGVVIDTGMLDNILNTDPQEVIGLASPALVIRTLLLGVLPAWLVVRYQPQIRDFTTELKARTLAIGVMLATITVAVLPFTASYASFIREHKMTRFYANPVYFSYSTFNYFKQRIKLQKNRALQPIADDAVEVGSRHANELVILVVGESARADRFFLNGYERETNPALSRENVVSLRNVASCGTSTEDSVPCMFSLMGRKGFDKENALYMENALDVLHKNGVRILWRDNNSSSKGVATRVQYENFRDPARNPVCDEECRDIGMLAGLEQYIASHKNRDILIVLHQMGSHGPEYYRRYPPEFERFKPTCKSGELQTCQAEALNNAYDNTILYTDYFLSKVINFLKSYDATHEVAMLYVSDHGESLGEKGLYLHAAPYVFAPREQTHIPAVVWMGDNFDFRPDQLKPYQNYPLSHDDMFCMLLVAFEFSSKVCEGKKAVLMQNQDLKHN